MLKHGKHSGAPYQQVAAEDRKYCAWVLREDRDSNQLSHNMNKAIKFSININLQK